MGMAMAMAMALARACGDEEADLRDESDFEEFFGLWGLFHGLTSLEVNHHLDWIDSGRLYERRVRWYFEQLGVVSRRSLHTKVKRMPHLRAV